MIRRYTVTAAAARRLFILGLVAVTAACAGVPAAGTAPNLSEIHTVAMMPVQNMAAIYGIGRNVRNPLSGSVYITGTVTPDAAQFFETAVFSKFSALERFRLLAPERSLGILSTLTSRDASPIVDRTLWIESARALKADGVLVCFLYRFIERIGSRYAAERPASVAFDIYLLRVPDGRILWAGRFDETQRALSENLLEINKFVKRKGWISAADMTAAGLDDLLGAIAPPRPAAGAAQNDP